MDEDELGLIGEEGDVEVLDLVGELIVPDAGLGDEGN